MKKIIALLLVLTMVLAFAACSTKEPTASSEASETTGETTQETTEEVPTESETGAAEAEGTVMTHEEYMAAEMNSAVCVETYVQAAQSWWDNKITVYAQSEDGAYFIYNMECSEETAAKLVPGTKIRVNGFKGEWSGEVEIMDATFEIIDGSYIADAFDATELLGTDELINHQNEKVSFTGLTVEKVEYQNGEAGSGNDIYVTLSKDGASYDFCVEAYLTGPDSDVYTTAGALKAGDVVDIEGFLYWYNGVNTHITSVTVK